MKSTAINAHECAKWAASISSMGVGSSTFSQSPHGFPIDTPPRPGLIASRHSMKRDIESQCRAGTRGCVDCKGMLAESLIEAFAPFRAKAAELEATPGLVAEILGDGAETARAVARETLREARELMGLDWRAKA